MFGKNQASAILLAFLLESASAGPAHQKFHQQRADICGSKGYDSGEGNYYYDASSKYNTYSACAAKCAADTKCRSFGYGKTECMLFNIPLTGNFDASSGSTDTYYDRGCLGASPSIASTTTSSTKATTTTTTTSKATSKSTSVSSSVKTTTTPVTPAVVSTTTTKAAATSASSSPAATGDVAVPAGCSVPAPISITGFSWFNSTHNLVRTFVAQTTCSR